MNIGWFIGLASAFIIFFIAYFIFSRQNYKRRFGTDYDLRNHFPYEFNFEAPFSLNILGNVFLILACAVSIGFFALTSAEIKNNGFIIYSLITGVLYSIAIGVVNFIPLKTIKTHLLFSVILYGVAFATPCAIGLGAFNVYQGSKSVFALVTFIISMVVGLFHFVLIMNPKVSLNIKMQAAIDEKGNEIYIRPKYIMMAFTEWLLSFEMITSQILLILFMLCMQ